MGLREKARDLFDAFYYPLGWLLCLQLLSLLSYHLLAGFVIYGPIFKAIAYFMPDYEVAIVENYQRPVIGLHLCRPCRELKNTSFSNVTQHHDNEEKLRSSGKEGCWLCATVYSQLQVVKLNRADPPQRVEAELGEDLKRFRLLIRVAGSVTTKSGYLDELKTHGYYFYVWGRQPRALAEDPASESMFDIARSWVQRCGKGHRCYQGRDAELPTRVIDVSRAEPYLLVTNGQKGQYMTLSHCWGGQQPVTTTLATLEARTSGLSMEMLPPLYCDAIKVTRELGIKYLWIDSLCIIQDSEVDWSLESAKMGEIYRCSYLTLYALDSQNCHQGILTRRLPTINDDIIPSVEKNIVKSFATQRQEIFKHAPLCQRAWALQERLLSPRILYYSNKELFWECLECTARESSHRINGCEVGPYVPQSYECPTVRMSLILPPYPGDITPSIPASCWLIVVTEYTRCHLTVQLDKLPALSGLASLFQQRTGYTYLAGLWKEDLANNLLWFIPHRRNQVSELQPSFEPVKEYRGPSWSWVATNLPVQFKSLERWNDRALPSQSDITLRESFIVHLEQNPMGKVAIASITMDAYVKRIFYGHKQWTNQKSSDPDRYCIIYDSNKDRCGNGILDSTESIDSCEESEGSDAAKSCLAVFITQREFQPNDEDCRLAFKPLLYFLIVTQVPPYEGAKDIDAKYWKRIGLGWTIRTLDGWSLNKETLTLI